MQVLIKIMYLFFILFTLSNNVYSAFSLRESKLSLQSIFNRMNFIHINEEKYYKMIQKLVTKHEITIKADNDDRTFIFKLKTHNIERSFLIEVYTQGKQIGYVDVVGSAIHTSVRQKKLNKKERFGIMVVPGWRRRYRGIGSTLLELAIGINKWINKQSFLLVIDVATHNIPFYGKHFDFGIFWDQSNQDKGIFTLGIHLKDHKIQHIGIKSKNVDNFKNILELLVFKNILFKFFERSS